MRNILVHQAHVYALGGRLTEPNEVNIRPQPVLILPSPGGEYRDEVENFSVSGISFKWAETYVSGKALEDKPNAYRTQVRVTVRELNILGFVTAKSMTAHMIATVEEADLSQEGLMNAQGTGLGLGPEPKFTFYATQFDELRVGDSLVPWESTIKGGQHPADADLERLQCLYNRSGGVRLVSTLSQHSMARNEEAVARNRRLLLEGDPTEGSGVRKNQISRDSIRRNEVRPIRVPGFGQVHVAELRYDPFTPEFSLLRVELDEGTYRGQILSGMCRGGPTCFPKSKTFNT